MQEKVIENKISQLNDPQRLNKIMKSIFDRTSDVATKQDSRLFLLAFERRLRQILAPSEKVV